MRHHRVITAGLTVAAGLFAVSVAAAVPAQADPADLGQSICPMLADSGSTLSSAASEAANATSGIHGKTAAPPEMTQFFSQMALSAYCPAALASLSNGRLPDVPGVLSDAPGSSGLFEGGGLPVPGAPAP